LSAPFDKILVIDFETRWDSKEYTLSKMTTEQYVRDARFKAFGLCYKTLDVEEDITWVSHDDIQNWVDSIDWSRTAVLAHNAQFDISILSWVYGAKPVFIFDSLSMARALRGVEAGNSLMKLAEIYQLPPKGNAVHSTNGMTELAYEVEQELAEYCKHDVFLCEKIFENLMLEVEGGFPIKELKLIDMTLKMFTNPVLELDEEMLREAIADEKEKREAILAKIGIEETALASNDQFANVLVGLGCVPPRKVSKTTGKEAYAFAKNDALFQALLNSDNEDISIVCEARLKVKSTLERTRAQRFVDIAERGTLPVPLNYYGAHTGRWSASKGSGLNLQNLKRGSFLRKSIQAPENHTLVVCDLSQIEPRVLAYLADYQPLLDIFASGQDAYAAFGAQMFGIPGLNKKDHADLRQSAKSALLGCGYGMGWASFAAQLLTGFLGAPPTMYDKTFAKQLGVTSQDVNDFIGWEKNMEMMAAIPHTCSDKDLLTHCLAAKKIIDIYRSKSQDVVNFWELCNSLLRNSMYQGFPYVHKCLTFDKERILLPSGLALKYPQLTGDADEKGRIQWSYGADEKSRRKLYGGKIVENVVQAVARCVMTDGMLRIQKRYSCVLTVHDEVVVLVPENEAKEAEAWVLEQMVKDPAYMPGIPLDAETGCNKRYGEAK
jgi:DNA polymerase I-like protein with 3'-5' exonuclease and polymerase domains